MHQVGQLPRMKRRYHLEFQRHKWEGNNKKALEEGACEFVDWFNVHQVEERRFLWTGFICLKRTSGDSSGLGFSALSIGSVEIPFDRVYLLPLVDQRRPLWNGFICFLKWTTGDSCGLGLSDSSCGPVEIPVH